MTITVDRFAELFGIDRNISYGILRFLNDAGLVQTSKQDRPAGADGKKLKGKPATLYHLDSGLGERLVAHLREKLGDMNAVPIPEPMPELLVENGDCEVQA